ncbi:ankyrin repeat domain-containing protein 45 isoform X2 [Macrotis lagotis]
MSSLLEPEPPKEPEVSDELETIVSEDMPGLNPLLRYILMGNIERLQRIFEDPEDPHHSDAMQLVMEEDVIGRNVLYTACMAGQNEALSILAKNGVNLNEKTARGYTLLHCAAAWGQLETLKTLVDLEVDMEALNFRNETARDVALRYSQMECVDYLDFAGAHLALKKSIAKIQTIMADPEKGKMTKEEKNLLTFACKTNLEWLELHPNPTIEELDEQKQKLEELVNPIYMKIALPRLMKNHQMIVYLLMNICLCKYISIFLLTFQKKYLQVLMEVKMIVLYLNCKIKFYLW